MTPSRTPLRDRIAARAGLPVDATASTNIPRNIPEPKAEPWRPPWLRNLAARDETGRVLS